MKKNKMEVKEVDILKFWNWFSTNSKIIESNFENCDMLSNLDLKVRTFGDLAWELGSGIIKQNLFIISPGGNIDLLPLTKKIVGFAPNVDNWEFYSAKQPKDWNLRFSSVNVHGENVTIDANNWQYVLLKYGENDFEIIIYGDELKELCPEDKIKFCEILLDGILGEELRMLNINQIDVVDDFGEYENNRTSMPFLKEHFSLNQKIIYSN